MACTLREAPSPTYCVRGVFYTGSAHFINIAASLTLVIRFMACTLREAPSPTYSVRGVFYTRTARFTNVAASLKLIDCRCRHTSWAVVKLSLNAETHVQFCVLGVQGFWTHPEQPGRTRKNPEEPRTIQKNPDLGFSGFFRVLPVISGQQWTPKKGPPKCFCDHSRWPS